MCSRPSLTQNLSREIVGASSCPSLPFRPYHVSCWRQRFLSLCNCTSCTFHFQLPFGFTFAFPHPSCKFLPLPFHADHCGLSILCASILLGFHTKGVLPKGTIALPSQGGLCHQSGQGATYPLWQRIHAI